MKKPTTVNVLFIATVSAIFHGAVAVVFVPLLSMVMLSYGALPAPLASFFTVEHGMIFAIAAPFAYAAIGFGCGALMAFLYNLFVQMHRAGTMPPTRTVKEPALNVRSAAIGDAA